MFPVAVVSRLGPWLSRLGPAAAEAAYAALAKVGIKVASAGELVAYINANKGAVAGVMTTLASAGYAVSDLFSPADKADPESRRSALELAIMEQKAIDARFSEVAKTSEIIAGISGKGQDLRMLREICVWAKGHYGSAESAIDAFNKQQAFYELSEDDVRLGFELLV